ncbi:MAG: DNA-directed RNA polymerase subunit beta, partial [Armatimonadota bacterium]
MRIIHAASKRIHRHIEVPNLIELQLNSYRWFLEEGLPELFRTFSPIYDFTQTNFIELVSFSLGEPKYSIQECRDRDITFEAPIKGIVRFGGKDREVIESEVYLGDLPLMTDKGTFIINGRERVIVSQLSRSPGLYFEEGVDSSMQVVVSARVIPNEGPWLEVESDANFVVRTQISQTKKLPITQLVKALYSFYMVDENGKMKTDGRGARKRTLTDAIGKKTVEKVIDASTGEVLLDVNVVITEEVLAKLDKDQKALQAFTVTPLSTNEEILTALTRIIELKTPMADDLIGKRVLEDIKIGDELIIAKGEKIEAATAKRMEDMEIPSIHLKYISPLVEATLEADSTATSRDALLDIYKRMRPGEAANEDAAKQLVYGLFFDVRRYDLGKVGRRFLNQKLGLDIPLNVRNLTAEDLAHMMLAMEPYVRRES